MLTLLPAPENEFEIRTLNQKPGEKRVDRVRGVAQDLRGGRLVTDFRFDQVYPGSIRGLSRIHWTPVEVAIRAAELLVTDERTRILDVGSGCGKFCTVAALSSIGNFTGVEQREYLVDLARAAVTELGAERVQFRHANMRELDWAQFDAFYLFNPFHENKDRSIRIDDTVSLCSSKFNRAIETVSEKLRELRVGTRVATYHGFGGVLPFGYRLAKSEPMGTSKLELWIKAETNQRRRGE